MIRISPFTPLFFHPSTDNSGVRSRYVQTFARTDHILIEILTDETDAAPAVKLTNKVNLEESKLVMSEWDIGNRKLCFFILQNLFESYYTVTIGDVESELFYVTEDKQELENTVLLQYANKDNSLREDVVFDIAGMRNFFEFRVHGGFKDNGWAFDVESEQFVTSEADIVSLYARESTRKTLTVGYQIGCPIWFGEMLNRLLTCEYVYVDGVRYCRRESSVPEITEVEGARSFIFKQQMQEVKYLDPKIEEKDISIFRRWNDTYFRASETCSDGVEFKPLKIN